MLRHEKQWQILNANNYYQHSANPRGYRAEQGFAGKQRCDVAIIGAGFAGLSAGLELAKRGYRVRVLEAKKVGFGASGRNGGQVLAGYACGQTYLEQQLGLPAAKHLFAMSLEAIALIQARIAEYNIECDWVNGFYYAGVKAKSEAAMQRDVDYYSKTYQFEQTYIPRAKMGEHIQSARYCCALQDEVSGHLHPLNYQLGLAKAATDAGCILHEDAEVQELIPAQGASHHRIKLAAGELESDFVLVAGNALLGNITPRLAAQRARILPVGTYIGATEPLPAEVANTLIAGRRCVADNQFVLDYFRMSADHRLLFGGRVNYTSMIPKNLPQTMREGMCTVFPQLAATKMDFAWGGYVDVTLNRAPDFGRLANHPSIFYVQGFSGHGVGLAGLAGKIMAEAVAGQAERFDAFAPLKHRAFPGGALFHAPLYALGMLYYRLRDFF